MDAAGLSPDYGGIDPRTLAAASQRGTRVHAAIAQHHLTKGKRPSVLAIAPFAGYFAGYRRFLDDTDHQPLYSEQLVEHATWRYRGHLDRVGWLNNYRALLDWKCVETLDKNAATIQLAAYEMAWNFQHPDEQVERCYAVVLRRDATYRLVSVNTAAALPIWKAALTLYHARVRMGRVAPGMVSV